jgi:CRISPR/Cas system CSM-associated protein Csm4 (group 5 of RAMP superfamily)
LDGAAYRLVERRGWLASPDAMNLRRKSVRMLQEGSFFTQRPGGALVDVKPQDTAYPRLHDVWRYGLGFPVACSPAQGEEGKDDG